MYSFRPILVPVEALVFCGRDFSHWTAHPRTPTHTRVHAIVTMTHDIVVIDRVSHCRAYVALTNAVSRVATATRFVFLVPFGQNISPIMVTG